MILSHTFTFTTQDSQNPGTSLDNLMAITEEDEKKHFIQYIQYTICQDQKIIQLRYVNIKVDRPYYLEIANINLNNQNRRRQFFSVLGKRRFGANNKRMDYYLLNESINTNILEKEYLSFYETKRFEDIYTQTTDYSTNEYRIHTFKMHDSSIYFLDQINITQRKRLHKTFCVELYPQEVDIFNTIQSNRKKVDYLFNKVGKLHFKALPLKTLKKTEVYKNYQALASSVFVKSSSEMETTSRVHDNKVFRTLKERLDEGHPCDFRIHSLYKELLNTPNDEDLQKAFFKSINNFIQYIENITQLESIQEHFRDLRDMLLNGTISYLLVKKDNDFRDIFLYMLESFEIWYSHLTTDNEDIKSFNHSTIDFISSLQYLTDSCHAFKHEYTCNDLQNTGKEVEIVLQQESVTSASKYFNEVELDPEVYDELTELENDVELLNYAQEYDNTLNTALIRFFEGYTKALNPLFEFKDLSYSLMLLGQKLNEYKLDENSEMLLMLMRGLISDLLEWKRTVLVEKTAEDIHYMDKSFYSNIAQIEMSLDPREVEEEEEDMIEFF